MHIACTADEAYAPHCAAMLLSLLDHNDPRTTTIHYLHPHDLDPEVLTAMTTMVEEAGASMVSHAFRDEELAGLSSMRGVRPLMWCRIFLPDRLPDLDRVLYLDADTLVLDKLDALWNMPLDGAHLAAVTNITPPMHYQHLRSLGIDNIEDYFNSGVLLMNLERMRDEGVATKLVDYGRQHRFMWWDQDALNVFFNNSRVRLHPRWNSMASLFLSSNAQGLFDTEAIECAREYPAIVHFEGPVTAKPWHHLCKHPYQAHYLRYRAQSPWPLRQFEGYRRRNHLLRLLPARVIVEWVGFEFRMKRKIKSLWRRPNTPQSSGSD